jgi:ABC-type polysaccharide/polyol phosphate transport system ATPase subunit
MELKIELENVSKKFPVDYKIKHTALSRIVSLTKKRGEIVVLDNVSLKVYAGEKLGIIGKNGSGKSTLLRLIAEVYQPNSGKVKTRGNMIYLAGLSHILEQKLTVRENILLAGSILGLSQKDIKAKMEEIINFSDLKDFVDFRIYQLSDGMKQRLNFSIVIHCLEHNKPEILLLDEIFSGGGDLDFQNKAIQRMEELVKKNATLILVSHDLDLIEKYCDRAILMDKGKVIKEGSPEEVINEYIKKG